MAFRILLLLLSIIIIFNLIICGASFATSTNIYKKYSKQLWILFGVFILLFALLYVVLPIIGNL